MKFSSYFYATIVCLFVAATVYHIFMSVIQPVGSFESGTYFFAGAGFMGIVVCLLTSKVISGYEWITLKPERPYDWFEYVTFPFELIISILMWISMNLLNVVMTVFIYLSPFMALLHHFPLVYIVRYESVRVEYLICATIWTVILFFLTLLGNRTKIRNSR